MDKSDVILRDSAGFNVSGGRTRHRRARVRGRLGLRRRLVAVGGRHLRAPRIPVHGDRRAGRADHLGQRRRHRAAGHPCVAPPPRREPGSRPSWNGFGSADTGQMPQTRRAMSATMSGTCAFPSAGAELAAVAARHQPCRRRLCRPRGFRIRRLPLFSRTRSRILRRTRLAEGLTMQYGAMTLTALAGATLALQVGMNATMRGHAGSPMAAALVNFAIGTVFLLVAVLLGRNSLAASPESARRPGGPGAPGSSGDSTSRHRRPSVR